MVEHRGFEPLTSTMRTQRATKGKYVLPKPHVNNQDAVLVQHRRKACRISLRQLYKLDEKR
jgi:hypothetical protein